MHFPSIPLGRIIHDLFNEPILGCSFDDGLHGDASRDTSGANSDVTAFTHCHSCHPVHSTTSANNIAREPEIAGIVLIAGAVHHASVAEATYPKLFISGALDRRAFDIEMGYEKAAEPKELVLFEDNRAHGTDLFTSKDSEAFL